MMKKLVENLNNKAKGISKMKELRSHISVETKRGVLLAGVLFDNTKNPDTVMIAITGIHGNFYSNPYYLMKN